MKQLSLFSDDDFEQEKNICSDCVGNSEQFFCHKKTLIKEYEKKTKTKIKECKMYEHE